MLVLLLFAGIFYMERADIYDLSLHVLVYLKDNTLFIQNQRFVSAVTQIWPLLAGRAGMPLDYILLLYSLIFVGCYLFVYAVVAYVFKNQQVALVVPLVFTLLVSNTFYWAQSELHQAIAALLLYYGGIARLAPLRADWRTAGLLLLIPISVYGHPLLILPFLFIWGYDYLLNRRFRDWGYYLTLVVALASYWYRTHNIVPGSYEAQRMNLWENIQLYFPNYWSLEGNHQLVWMLRNRLYMLPVLLAALTAFYVVRRPPGGWLRLAWIWVYTLFYTQVVAISYPGHTEYFYLENLYLPLGIFVAVPFAMELLPALRPPRLAGAVLAAVFIFRLAVIWQTHVPYTAYSHWMEHVLSYARQYPERKYVLDKANADPYNQRIDSWASSFESLLMSSRVSPDSAQSLLITDQVEQRKPRMVFDDLLLMAWDELGYKTLPTKYFRPKKTIYRLLNTPPPTDSLALLAYIQERRDVKLTPLEFDKSLRINKVRYLGVTINTPAGRTLNSGMRVPHPTVLTYRFLSAGDWPFPSEILTTPLEVDVDGTWTQNMALVCPPEPGKYILEVTLASRDFKNWPVQVRMPVEVTK